MVIVGPTASGKSTLAARLGQALGGEVVSADSVQIYRHFDIGSGKPSASELALCPHHLIDMADPLEPLDAAMWAEQAHRVIEQIRERGRVPIVCGGTFLWVKALLFGLAAAPQADADVRARHRHVAETGGPGALHAELAAVDPKSAARLHENDFVRVSRALEVYELSGATMSEIQEAHGFREPRYSARLLGIRWSPAEYEARVEARVRAMLRAGLALEVERLVAAGYRSTRAMATVGYLEVATWLEQRGAAPPGPVPLLANEDELVAAIVRSTRILARRQRTWLREQPVQWLPPAVLTDETELGSLAERLRAELTA